MQHFHNTWSYRARLAVQCGIDQARELCAGSYLTVEERTLWAGEAKRLYAVLHKVEARMDRQLAR